MTNTNQINQARQRNSHLVLGGARSGKSSFAEQQALCAFEACSNGGLNYIATATYLDDEMRERIAHHQQRRGEQWIEHEAPVELAEELQFFTRVLFVCFQIKISTRVNSFKLFEAHWEVKFYVRCSLGIVRQVDVIMEAVVVFT